MAKAWLWVLIGVVVILGFIWTADYWYNYHTTGTCWDSRGNPYACGKAYRYSDNNYNYLTYSYYDNYDNRVTVDRSYNFDDYYDCYHARTMDSRYGELLREEYGIRCRGYEAVNDNYNARVNTNNRYVSEKAPLIYVR